MIDSTINLYYFIFQDQLKLAKGDSSPQLSASSEAPWTLAPATLQ